MAERTISIRPLPKSITIDLLQSEFAGLGVESVALLAEEACAYIQFSKPAEVEALAARYPDCRVPTLEGAQIGLVEAGFRWPVPKVTGRAECLVVVRGCTDLQGVSQARIRQIFRQYAIEKVAKFEESGQVVLQFHSQDDLQLIEMNFDNFAVPDLGPQARIDVDNAFPLDRFLQRYLQRHQVRQLPLEKVKQEQPIYRAQEEQGGSKRKLEQMERDIAQKERARKSEAEAFERTRREKEERERIERFAKEKRQRDERERREQIELEERRKQEQRKREEEQRRQQEEQKQKEQEVRLQELRKQEEEKEAQRRKQEEQQQRLLAQRIASIKQEVEQVERKMKKEQKVEEEPELERIIFQQKQLKKRQIKLPEINNMKPQGKETKITVQKSEEAKGSECMATPTVKKDYSVISFQFITVVVVAWIYYVLVR